MKGTNQRDLSILPLLALLLSAAVLVFAACGTLEMGVLSRTVMPSSSTTASTSTPVVEESPLPPVLCRPEQASMNLAATATTLGVGQTVTVRMTLVNGETSNVRLGQPQYVLHAHPDVFSLDGMEPVERSVTLDPGQSDEIEFVLQAATPGRAVLMGTVGYEMHDLEYSWASWSGCNAEPLEITITP